MEYKNRILCGDSVEILRTLPENSTHMCVTSPPYYGLRDYGAEGQIGLEETPERYVQILSGVFDEVRRVLRPDGTLWINIADSYAGSGKGAWNKVGERPKSKHTYRFTTDNPAVNIPKIWPGVKPKDMIGIPWLLAFALRERGWYLRSDIIWHKPNVMPESVADRPTKSHEHLFLLAKSSRYYFDHKAIKEPTVDGAARTRNCRDVWSISTSPYKGAHFATFPVELIVPCILAGSPAGGVVLDPFFGSGTTGVAALRLNRSFIGIDINPNFCRLADERIKQEEKT